MVDRLSNEPDFRATDYKDMVFPLHQASNGEDIMTRFPIFAMYKVFFTDLPGTLTLDRVMPYISYCFDKGSPFIKKYNDIVERRFWAAVQAGFRLNDANKSFQPEVEDMIRGKNRSINNMIIQYVLLQGDEDFSIFVAYNEALKQQLSILLNLEVLDTKNDPNVTPVRDIKTITENVKNLRSQIAEIRFNMFHTVDDRLLNQALYDFMEAGNLQISPESYAEKKAISQSHNFNDQNNEWGTTDIYELQ